MPKISVLMPVYNTESKYLKTAIESILNQTFKDFEFVIIDDGSTNNVKDVILSYKDNRIKYIEQENQGIAKTLNNGLKIARGEYIARMDSDDISLPERFEKQLSFLEKNPSISVLGTWFETFPNKKTITRPFNPKYLDFLESCCMAHPSIMFRKSDFDKYNLRYDENLRVSEDYDLWSRAIKFLNFANLQETLLKYRILENSNFHKNIEKVRTADNKIRANMLNFLTNDEELRHSINNLIFPQNKPDERFLEKIFSVKNHIENGVKRKVICVLGIKFKFKKYSKIRIVRLMGGLGNQMFQWAFLRALENKTHNKVLADITWFDEAKKNIVNDKNENSQGVAIRKYELDIFKFNAVFATKLQSSFCKKKIFETKEFEFDPDLLKDEKSVLYEGYFQNEGYLKNIKEQIKKDFTFPKIPSSDKFNQNWLNKINACENPVFIHLRRGDYVNLGWDLSTDYYKKAIEYIKNNVQNPTFFVFGQDCEDYIKKEFNFDIPFEIIGEENSKNKQDWKDIVLMEQCRHAIIANSTFSWWAAWLGRANEDGIVVAPTPFVNGKDSIICDNWVKIER